MSYQGNKNAFKHGYAHLPEYRIWLSMKSRCYNSKAKDYKTYGAKGITICPKWLKAFEHFYEDMGPRPSPDHQIDRKNNKRGYSRSNCRWITRAENMKNKSNTTKIKIAGVTKTLKEWSVVYGINYETAKSRRRKGLKGKAIFK
jgi:hypothetical protein